MCVLIRVLVRVLVLRPEEVGLDYPCGTADCQNFLFLQTCVRLRSVRSSMSPQPTSTSLGKVFSCFLG